MHSSHLVEERVDWAQGLATLCNHLNRQRNVEKEKKMRMK
jgi:hypothetical protein